MIRTNGFSVEQEAMPIISVKNRTRITNKIKNNSKIQPYGKTPKKIKTVFLNPQG
jgi:hypothetical protein